MPRASFDLVSPEATHALAHGLASVLQQGDIIALSGELGAGKTTFVRSVVEALGGDKSLVASPTFVIVHVYPATSQPRTRDSARIERVTHIDAYRLTSAEDLEPIGWDRLFQDSSGGPSASTGSVAFVEWPERIAGHLPAEHSRANVLIEHLREDARRFTISLPDSWSARDGVDLLLSRPPSVCPKTRRWVSPTSPSYPFADERSRSGDLYGWLTESYKVSRAAREGDQDIPAE